MVETKCACTATVACVWPSCGCAWPMSLPSAVSLALQQLQWAATSMFSAGVTFTGSWCSCSCLAPDLRGLLFTAPSYLSLKSCTDPARCRAPLPAEPLRPSVHSGPEAPDTALGPVVHAALGGSMGLQRLFCYSRNCTWVVKEENLLLRAVICSLS